jgi:phosphate transport system substrate-binding protein
MKKRLLALCMTLMMVAGLAIGCSSPDKSTDSKEEDKKAPVSSSQIYFNGSSTLAPVITTIATNFNEEHGTWDKVDSKFPEEAISIYVAAGGSGQGTKAIIDGTTTFGMVAREVKDEEKKAIKDEKEYQVGIDALTLAVNPENPVTGVLDNLTKDQIVKIFSGEFKTWKDLDASLPEEKIVVITRDISGGAHEVFQKNIMGDTDVTSEAIQAPTMGGLVEKIIDNKYAIGYASYGVANQNEGKIKVLKVDGVEANEANILDGSYIIQRPLLLVGSGKAADEQQAFLDVVLGEEGQAIVKEMGFIPMK